MQWHNFRFFSHCEDFLRFSFSFVFRGHLGHIDCLWIFLVTLINCYSLKRGCRELWNNYRTKVILWVFCNAHKNINCIYIYRRSRKMYLSFFRIGISLNFCVPIIQISSIFSVTDNQISFWGYQQLLIATEGSLLSAQCSGCQGHRNGVKFPSWSV